MSVLEAAECPQLRGHIIVIKCADISILEGPSPELSDSSVLFPAIKASGQQIEIIRLLAYDAAKNFFNATLVCILSLLMNARDILGR